VTAGALVAAWAMGLFGIGAVTIAAYGLRDRARAHELWIVYASTVVIAAALLVPLALSSLLFSLVVAAAAYRCTVELATTYDLTLDASRHAGAVVVAVAATAWGASQDASATLLLYVATAVVVAVSAPFYVRAFTVKPQGARAWLLALAFPLAAAAHLAHLANRPDGFAWVFVLYATVETQDSAAYLCGRLFGRRLLLPRLSPKKTVGGAVAGAVCGMAVGGIAAHAFLDLSLGASIGLAALITAAGFAGDLYTSALKRGAGVKDFPAVHRLHGGVLDIYDSTLFGAVVLSIAVYIIAAWTF
jgi:CDP-diglyceride synthetase